ncbi:MAG: heavy metal translocating P-type ATPase metal-binding domain-containing protein, partial [Flavobacteriales bacterium]
MKDLKPCYHCGDDCHVEIQHAEKVFCCNGCKMVFEILSENGMDQYYDLEQKPGTKPKEAGNKYQFLENDLIAEEFYDYKSETQNRVTLFLPQIHCSSCVWLLENLNILNKGVLKSEVHFTKKEAHISFDPNQISLIGLTHLLDKIGYAPTFEKKEKRSKKKLENSFFIKLGVTGFCFGNIMLLSFPEYLGIGNDVSETVSFFMQIIIVGLSLPILFMPAWDYIKSGYKSLKTGHINIDVPVSIGIITLYCKSLFDILIEGNASYMDSFAAFIFFLLIGKWFQNKTYNALSFERDYTSYFPIAVSKLSGEKEEIIKIYEIEKEDILVIRNGDIIPVDCTLIGGNANIDYSFVTGESQTQRIETGQKLYAGGKQLGTNITVNVLEKVNQSYLTHLWNQSAFDQEESSYSQLNTRLSKYFTWSVLGISLMAAGVWFFIDSSKVVNVVVSILIVACPCALALAVPFTFGSALRYFGKTGFYLRNIFTIEDMSQLTDVVFDKTGTITYANTSEIEFIGEELSQNLKKQIAELTNNSTHILSRNIRDYLSISVPEKTLVEFEEIVGKGIRGTLKSGETYLLGSAEFTGEQTEGNSETRVYVKLNKLILGYFLFKNLYRTGVPEMMNSLKENYRLHILSGDNELERENLKKMLPNGSEIHFNQKPIDKLTYIQ